jgi:hypothetical protein
MCSQALVYPNVICLKIYRVTSPSGDLSGAAPDPLLEASILHGVFSSMMSTNLERLPMSAALVHGRYELLRRIGSGSNGQVHQAVDQLLENSAVAIKLLHTNTAQSEKERETLQRQLLRLREHPHDHIVRIYECYLEVEPRCFSMELVDGCSLAEVLSYYGQQLPWRTVVLILIDLLRGLVHAHENSILHGDIKPANILLTSTGIAKVADFGLFPDLFCDVKEKQPWEVLGTPAYMSPEQFRGAEVSVATDMYAFGVLGYELLCGVRPFTEQQYFSLAQRHMTESVSLPRQVSTTIPAWLRQLVEACLAKTAAQRPASMRQILETLLEHGEYPEERQRVAELVRKTRRRLASAFRLTRRTMVTAATMALTCAAMLLTGVIVLENPNSRGRIGAQVLSLEQQFGTEFPLVKRILRTTVSAHRPEELFDLLHTVSTAQEKLVETSCYMLTHGGTAKKMRYSGERREWRGNTLLHHTALSPGVNVDSKDREFRELIRAGEDVNAKNRQHDTPLHFVTEYAGSRYVQILLENGATPFARNRAGIAPIHLALQRGDIALVQIFLDALALESSRRALANYPTTSGEVPLNLVARLPEEQRAPLVRLLRRHGAVLEPESKMKVLSDG